MLLDGDHDECSAVELAGGLRAVQVAPQPGERGLRVAVVAVSPPRWRADPAPWHARMACHPGWRSARQLGRTTPAKPTTIRALLGARRGGRGTGRGGARAAPQAARGPGKPPRQLPAASGGRHGVPFGPGAGACVRAGRGRSPGMPDPHPQPASTAPTSRQQRYLRRLAEQTSTSFTPPKTRAGASREIDRLQGRSRDSRSERVPDRHTVQADLQAGAGDAVRHQPAETTGYGSGARWAHRRTGAGEGR